MLSNNLIKHIKNWISVINIQLKIYAMWYEIGGPTLKKAGFVAR